MAYEYSISREVLPWQRLRTQNFFRAFQYHKSNISLSDGLRSLSSSSELRGYFSKALLMVQYTTNSSNECGMLIPPISHERSSSRLGVTSFQASSKEGNINVNILFKVFLGVFLLIKPFYIDFFNKTRIGGVYDK